MHSPYSHNDSDHWPFVVVDWCCLWLGEMEDKWEFRSKNHTYPFMRDSVVMATNNVKLIFECVHQKNGMHLVVNVMALSSQIFLGLVLLWYSLYSWARKRKCLCPENSSKHNIEFSVENIQSHPGPRKETRIETSIWQTACTAVERSLPVNIE